MNEQLLDHSSLTRIVQRLGVAIFQRFFEKVVDLCRETGLVWGMENVPLQDLLWRVCFRWKLQPRQVTGDTTYGTAANIVALEDAGIQAFFPLPDFDTRTPFFGKGTFAYDGSVDAYRCPGGALLPFRNHKDSERVRIYQAPAAGCNACPLKAQCTGSRKGRQIQRSLHEAHLNRVRGEYATEPSR